MEAPPINFPIFGTNFLEVPMLDIRKIRENPDFYREETRKKNSAVDLADVLTLDEKRRTLISQVESLKAVRNTASKKIGELKKAGQDASGPVEEMRQVGDQIAALDHQVKAIEDEQTDLLMRIPNIAHSSVPEGESSAQNVTVRSW